MGRTKQQFFEISIHAPLAGSDNSGGGVHVIRTDFNPRSPRGERHGILDIANTKINISIHAPLAGSD